MLAVLGLTLALTSGAAAAAPAEPLAWDAELKECTAGAGDSVAVIRFHLTNVSTREVAITQVTTSCGCTVAKIPHKPWVLKPREKGEIVATVDLRGKFGTLEKALYVQMPAMTKTLRLTVYLPAATADPERLANQALAKTDRQAVFKGKCATCHAEPLEGKMGDALYEAACEICHDPIHRASMVPTLIALPNATPDFWRHWIATGREGSLMPAFSRDQGGPLTLDQIESLVRLLGPRRKT